MESLSRGLSLRSFSTPLAYDQRQSNCAAEVIEQRTWLTCYEPHSADRSLSHMRGSSIRSGIS